MSDENKMKKKIPRYLNNRQSKSNNIEKSPSINENEKENNKILFN